MHQSQVLRGGHALFPHHVGVDGTDAGFERLEDAWPTNLAAVRRHFLDHLAGIDLKSLAAALQKVAM
jgi:hypothetical protein